jgi:hypothetical protein
VDPAGARNSGSREGQDDRDRRDDARGECCAPEHRADSGETYHDFLTRLAQASGIETPTRAELARFDRKRPKKGRNKEWRHPHDSDARITKMKDGGTHLAHKAKRDVDMETARSWA